MPIGVIAGIIGFIVRIMVLKWASMDLFDVLSHSYESLIFYSGLSGFLYAIREILDRVTLKMDANPNGNPGNNNPQPKGNPGNYSFSFTILVLLL